MRSPQPADPRLRLRTLLTQFWTYALRSATTLAELTPHTLPESRPTPPEAAGTAPEADPNPTPADPA